MKPRTYFGLALLVPYILWSICALVVFLLPSEELSETWNMVLMPFSFYVIGIILWFFPYALLAVGMWFWSKNKSTTTLYKLAMFAPVLLSVLMLIEAMLVSLPVDNVAEFTQELLGQSLFLGGFSLVFGYLCVGIALGVYRALQAKGLIVEESSPALEVVVPSITL